jgi:hypothetical protein
MNLRHPSPVLRRLALALGLGLLLGLLAGCSTFDSRAREKSAVFAALDEPTRARLEAREIHLGDTTDMVYIALGKPSEIQKTTDSTGASDTWIYNTYWQEYQGTRLVGHRRDVIYNPATKTYRVIYTPDYEPVYVGRAEERIRVTFASGRVTAIEQTQPPGGAKS